ncbi:hypothetical protein AB6A23_04910 [Paenibacillus tarimensis]
MNQSPDHRRSRAALSPITTTQIHLRNPWIVAFFAFSYPGFGNVLLHRYFKAFILILWEIFINHQGNVNLGIMYTLQGQFAQAKDVVDERWLMLYVGIYMYAIWDSYRSTIDINKLYILADREDAPLSSLKMGPAGVNYLDKKNPWVAFAWSAIVPGLGQLYVHKLILGFFIFLYTLAICYFSKLPLAIQYSMTGDFALAKEVVDMQWLLYLPSIYIFILYDAYVSAVEQNKLFEKEQSKFLRQNYQNPGFIMPEKDDKAMYVIATFEQNIFLEMAITALEQKGIAKDSMFAIPIDKRTEPRRLFDSIHRADGFSMLDLAAILGTCFMLLGAIYGYELKWGPILWGIIGAVSGFAAGFLIKLLLIKKNKSGVKYITSEVVLMVRCEVHQFESVEKTLWDNTALGISKVKHLEHRGLNG